MKKIFSFIPGLLVLLFILAVPVFPSLAETTASIRLTPKPANFMLFADGKTRIPFTVEVLDAAGNRSAEEGQAKISIERGGFTDPEVARNGVTLKGGSADFEMIAPSKPGPVLIKCVYRNLQAEVRLDFSVPPQEPIAWRSMEAKVTKLIGAASWRKSNSQAWKPLRSNQSLNEEIVVRTGEQSWVELQLFDQSEIMVQPKTELEIRVLKADKRNAARKQIILLLTSGKTLSKVKPVTAPGAKFEIGTASAAAGVRGTIFETEAVLNGLNVSVYEGFVDLTDLTRDLLYSVRSNQRLNWTLDGQAYTSCPSWEERLRELLNEQTAALNSPDNQNLRTENVKPEPTGNLAQASSITTASYITRNLLQEVIFSDEEKYHGYGFGFKPGFNLGPLEFGLDLSFYQNPEDNKAWQWGKPVQGLKPDMPNFVDYLAYHGRKLEFGYGKLNDLSLGYGLLMTDYHASDPDHGWFLKLNPWRSTRLIAYSQDEIVYLAPFYRNPSSSLESMRLEQDFWGLQLGVTGIQDQDARLEETTVPVRAASADLTLKVSNLLAPFVEVAQLENFGAGAQAGFRGKIGQFLHYKLSYYRCESDFWLNYYGGNYSARKEALLLEPPVLEADGPEKEWASGEVGVNLTHLLNLKVQYFDNREGESTISGNLSGKINLLKMEYGYLYYRCSTEEAFGAEWYLKGQVKWLGYDFRRYYKGEYLNSFKLSYRF